MKKLKFLVSLLMEENPYQRQHAAAAEEAGRRLGVDVQILYAKNDPLTQVEQLLNAIQSAKSDARPDGIICAPVGTTLVQVARRAVSAGIGWVLLNRSDEYLKELRTSHDVPAFCVAANQEEIGAIQARQLGALLPDGGLVLYILGPNGNSIAERRLNAMQYAKPENIQIRTLTGNWSEQSGYKSVSAWLQLSTSRATVIGAVAAQNDDMAMGARRAFEDLTSGTEKDRWTGLPFIGIDCCPGAGLEWTRKGFLAASIINPPGGGVAIETLMRALQTKVQPAELIQLMPESYPAIEQIMLKRPAKILS